MKQYIRPTVIVLSIVFLALLSVAFSRSIFAQSTKFANNSGAVLFFQATATSQPQQDRSEIGSTDSITVMSFAIIAIIIIPIFLRRKSWSQP